MAVTKGDTKGDTSSQGSNQSGDAFVAMPSISANDIVLSQSAASANLSQSSTSANECDEVHEAAGCAPLIRVDGPATPRSGSGVQHDNAGGEATDSPPTGLCLRPPPKSPFPTTAIGNVAGTPAEAILHTPQFESPRVNPCTPQYVLDQGKGTEVLLGDFGLAMVLEHKHELAPPGVNIYPQDYVVMNHNHGMVLQTREYRAPEVLLGQDFNVKIDVYSIACIIVELITGDYLWDPKNTVPARYCYTESEIDKEHFQHMIAVVGTDAFTKLKARRTFYRTKYFSACGEPKIDSRRRREPKSRPISSILSPHVPETMLTDLSHLLTKMLEFHPNDRWSASQCLDFLDQPAFHVLEDDFLHA
jgi:serine/threonine protein kinase